MTDNRREELNFTIPLNTTFYTIRHWSDVISRPQFDLHLVVRVDLRVAIGANPNFDPILYSTAMHTMGYPTPFWCKAHLRQTDRQPASQTDTVLVTIGAAFRLKL